MSDLLELLRSLDDEALAALASPGLVRRARRDLAADPPHAMHEETGEGLIVELGEHTVRFPPSGVNGAACSCRATECCRHVLAAVLLVRRVGEAGGARRQEEDEEDSGSGEASAGRDAVAELLALTRSELVRHCGKAAVDRATRNLEKLAPTIETGPTLRVRAANWECHFPAGADLAAVVSSAPPRRRKESIALAVLAVQRAHGVAIAAPTPTPSLPSARGAPRSRGAVLHSVDRLAAELVGVGLSHLSASRVQRLRTLSVSASAVALPRLALVLREAADDVELLLRRSARADEARLLATLARLHALVTALGTGETPSAALAGTFRSRYAEAGELLLSGLGAYRWRTRSGYRGLTLVFLDETSGRFVTWTDSRPQGADPTFEPRRRYLETPPWKGVGTPARASRHRLRLTGARLNERGRLSSTRSCRAVDRGPTLPQAVEYGPHRFAEWGALRQRAASTLPLGLAVPDEQASLVVVQPARWGRPAFDDIDQTLVVPLLDQHGDAVPLRVPYSPVNEGALRRVEAVAASPRGIWGLLARLRLHRDGAALYPLSLLLARPDERGEAVVNLTLDPLPRASAIGRWLRGKLARAQGRADEEIEDLEPVPGWSPGTEIEVARLEETVLRVAESGQRALDESTRELLRTGAARMREHGLSLLAAALNRLAEDPVAGRSLLALRYQCDLHRQAAVRCAIESPPSP